MEALASVIGSFDRKTLVHAAVQFLGVPLLVERLARVVIARTHQNITPADVAVLSQRFMRATVALTLVQGAARTLAQPEHAVFNIFEKTALGQYYMLGTVIFYLFDSVLLGLQRATTYDLWVHHLIAIGLYSYYLARGVSEMGGMLTLFSEILVPWGFMLFYFKLNKLQAHKFFQVIAYGGVATLSSRILIWLYLVFRLFGSEYAKAPLVLKILGSIGAPLGLCLDVYWMRLYLSNFPAHRRALAALNGAPAPSIWEAISKKK